MRDMVDEFESGQPRPPKVDPLAARLAAKPKAATAGKKIGGTMRLGAASKSSALRVPMGEQTNPPRNSIELC